MSRCVIIGGAPNGKYDRAKEALRVDDFCIYCDSGLVHQAHLCAAPGLIVGDFDSHAKPESAVETIVLPREKDDTDTMYAVKEGLRRGYKDFLLIGCSGKRLDHTLANLAILLYLDTRGIPAKMLDDYSEMEIVSGREVEVPDTFSYFSLVNISGLARGVTITGAKFPLRDAEITCDYAFAVSNEVLPGNKARISLREGRLLLIKDVE